MYMYIEICTLKPEVLVHMHFKYIPVKLLLYISIVHVHVYYTDRQKQYLPKLTNNSSYQCISQVIVQGQFDRVLAYSQSTSGGNQSCKYVHDRKVKDMT